METAKLAGSLGFFISALTELMVAVLFLEIIISTRISLGNFSFILVLFIFSLVIRTQNWRRLGLRSKNLLHRYTWLFVLLLGLIAVIYFLYFASSQMILLPLQDYAGTLTLAVIAALWSVYTALEILFRYSPKKKIDRSIALSIASIIVVDSSVFLGILSAYALPAAMLFLAASSVVTGIAAFREPVEAEKQHYGPLQG